MWLRIDVLLGSFPPRPDRVPCFVEALAFRIGPLFRWVRTFCGQKMRGSRNLDPEHQSAYAGRTGLRLPEPCIRVCGPRALILEWASLLIARCKHQFAPKA